MAEPSKENPFPGADPTVVDELLLEYQIEDINEQIEALNTFAKMQKKAAHEKKKFASLTSDSDNCEDNTDSKESTPATERKKRKRIVSYEEHQKKKQKKESKDGKKTSVLGAKTNTVAFQTKLKEASAAMIREEIESLKDFKIPDPLAEKYKQLYRPSALSQIKQQWDRPNDPKNPVSAALGRPPNDDAVSVGADADIQSYSDSSDVDDEVGKSLSVIIIDKYLRIVKPSAGGYKLIQGVPVYKSVSKVFRYVANRFFLPPLECLEPYAYKAKIGKGLPYPLPATTTLDDLKVLQKHKKVGVDRITIVAKSDLEGPVILSRRKAQEKFMRKGGNTQGSLVHSETTPDIVCVESSPSSSEDTDASVQASPSNLGMNNLNLVGDAEEVSGMTSLGSSPTPFPLTQNKCSQQNIGMSQDKICSDETGRMIGDVFRNTETIAAFVDHRTKVVEEVAKKAEDISLQLGSRNDQLDNIYKTTCETADSVGDIKTAIASVTTDLSVCKEKLNNEDKATGTLAASVASCKADIANINNALSAMKISDEPQQRSTTEHTEEKDSTLALLKTHSDAMSSSLEELKRDIAKNTHDMDEVKALIELLSKDVGKLVLSTQHSDAESTVDGCNKSEGAKKMCSDSEAKPQDGKAVEKKQAKPAEGRGKRTTRRPPRFTDSK